MGSGDPPNAQDLIGLVLDDRYRIEAVLGSGGMGMVFKGLQTSVQRPVAVKTLHAALAMSPAFFERFKREAEVASRLHHPNIITIYDFGRTAQGLCYIVMEYLEGESLRQRIRRQGPMTLRDAAAVIEQVAIGVGHAHKQQVVHRDLKPHNIMIAKVDGNEYVKVLDFGLVKALEEQEEDQLTSTGQVLGTPQYMPPEQAGGEDIDQRSDLYSLTGVLYFCLTGHSPFGANTVRKALQAALTQEVPPIASWRLGAPVPDALDRFMRQGLQKEKADRFQTTEDFIQALQAALAGTPDSVLDAVPRHEPDKAKGEGSGSSGSSKRVGSGSKPLSKSVSAVGRPLPKGSLRDAPVVEDAPRRSPLPWIAGAAAVLLVAVGGLVALKASRPPVGPPGLRPVEELRQDPPPLIATPKAPEAFKVTITTTPAGAEVLEDGAMVGKTPWATEWPKGSKRILVFKLAGYRDLEKSLKLDSEQALDFTLESVAHTPPTKTKPPKKKDDGIDTFE